MNRKYVIKIGIILGILVRFGFSYSFADGVSETLNASEGLQNLYALLHVVVSFCSRGWILLSKLGGLFLSNAFVFGDAFGFSEILWGLRNIMKNIANFTLGFFFLFQVFHLIFKKGAILPSDIFQIIKGILLAGIGVQMSRFLCASVLDISTISLAGVSGMGTTLLGNNNVLKDGFEATPYFQNLVDDRQDCVGSMLLIDPKESNPAAATQKVDAEKCISFQQVYDNFLPSKDDFSGPLAFIGMTLFSSFNLHTFDADHPIQSFINLILFDGGSLILYTISLAFITIVAMFRIVFLRCFIILSPFLLLSWGVQQGDKSGSSFLEDFFKKTFSITSFLKLSFWPVIAVLGLTLIEFFTATLQKIVPEETSQFEINGLHCQALRDHDTFTSSCYLGDSEAFHFTHLRQPILKVIVSLFTIILLWYLIKITLTFKTDIKFIDNLTTSGTTALENLAKNAQIIPLGSHTLSYNSLFGNKYGGGLIDTLDTTLTKALTTSNNETLKQLGRIQSPTPSEFTAHSDPLQYINAYNNSSQYILDLLDPASKHIQEFLKYLDNLNESYITKITDSTKMEALLELKKTWDTAKKDHHLDSDLKKQQYLYNIFLKDTKIQTSLTKLFKDEKIKLPSPTSP